MFRSWIESLNHFTDYANAFLKEVGCETFICTWNLANGEETALENFLRGGVYAAIMYNSIGMQFKELYDQLEIPVVNILMDHPMTFWGTMEEPSKKYIQFSARSCCMQQEILEY